MGALAYKVQDTHETFVRSGYPHRPEKGIAKKRLEAHVHHRRAPY